MGNNNVILQTHGVVSKYTGQSVLQLNTVRKLLMHVPEDLLPHDLHPMGKFIRWVAQALWCNDAIGSGS